MAIRAVDDQGNVGLPASAEYNPGAPLPALGRCVQAPAKKTGEWHGAHCVGYAHGKGSYNFLPGPGAAKKLTGKLGALTLETVGHAKITCQSGTGQGEYASSKGLTITLTLSGCERPSSHQSCQSVGSPNGQIVTSALEGELGFITSGLKIVVGLDLKHEPALATFECTTTGLPGKEVVAIEGSAIGPIKVIDSMVSGFTVAFKATAGKQSPEQFEGAAKDTLVTSIVGGAAEQAGLTATLTLTNEEPLEIKAKTRGGK